MPTQSWAQLLGTIILGHWYASIYALNVESVLSYCKKPVSARPFHRRCSVPGVKLSMYTRIHLIHSEASQLRTAEPWRGRIKSAEPRSTTSAAAQETHGSRDTFLLFSFRRGTTPEHQRITRISIQGLIVGYVLPQCFAGRLNARAVVRSSTWRGSRAVCANSSASPSRLTSSTARIQRRVRR